MIGIETGQESGPTILHARWGAHTTGGLSKLLQRSRYHESSVIFLDDFLMWNGLKSADNGSGNSIGMCWRSARISSSRRML